MPKAPSLPFRCDLCQKAYARISQLDTHESSYDHHHRKRAADIRIANRDTAKRHTESDKKQENSDIIQLPNTSDEGSQKKAKRGFKSAFGTASLKTSTHSIKQDEQNIPQLVSSKQVAAEHTKEIIKTGVSRSND